MTSNGDSSTITRPDHNHREDQSSRTTTSPYTTGTGTGTGATPPSTTTATTTTNDGGTEARTPTSTNDFSAATLQHITTTYDGGGGGGGGNGNNGWCGPNTNNNNNNNINNNNNNKDTNSHRSSDSVGEDSIPDHVLFIRFKHGEGRIYSAYFRREQRHLLLVVVFLTFAHAVTLTVLDTVPDNASWNDERLHRVVVLVTLTLLVFLLYVLQRFTKISQPAKETAAILAWFLLGCQMFYGASTTTPRHVTSDGLSWIALLTLVTQVTLPVGVWLAIVASLLLVGSHCVMAALRNDGDLDLALQIVSNALVSIPCVATGLAVSVFMDRLLRKSLLETKAVLSAKAKIEAAYQEKKSLLLSVLPRHVTEEMIQDVGEMSDGQFRKIYMSRYENVSILFADIVGFTAISSTVTAADLVQILNQLFGRFDVLANRYHQDRIKILGDCYYCVCGALTPRPDHAVLCIHMGLAVVETIGFVRHKTGKDVNMRVGVHTGACLGGVLGQRQWQFDVLGKEVTLANKMESGGIPARVHISETTRACLDGEFELEDGQGGEREEELRLKNLTTYLVKAVLKPYPRGTLDEVKTTERSMSTDAVFHNAHANANAIGASSAMNSAATTSANTRTTATIATTTTNNNNSNSNDNNSNSNNSNNDDAATIPNTKHRREKPSSIKFQTPDNDNNSTPTTETTTTTTTLVSSASSSSSFDVPTDSVGLSITVDASTKTTNNNDATLENHRTKQAIVNHPPASLQQTTTTNITSSTTTATSEWQQQQQQQQQQSKNRKSAEHTKQTLIQKRSKSVKAPPFNHHVVADQQNNGVAGCDDDEKDGQSKPERRVIRRNAKTRTTIAATSGPGLVNVLHHNNQCNNGEEGGGEVGDYYEGGLYEIEEDRMIYELRMRRGESHGTSIVEMDLQRALEEKDANRTLGGQTNSVTLSFKNVTMETRYKHRSQSYSGLPLVALCLSFCFVSMARFVILPRTALSITSYVLGQVILLVMAVVSMSATHVKKFPSAMVRFASTIESCGIARMLWGTSACAVFFLCDVIPIVDCDATPLNKTTSVPSTTSSLDLDYDTQDSVCRYVVYYAHITTLTLFAVTSLVNMGHVIKVVVMLLIAATQCLLYLFVLDDVFDNYDTVVYSGYEDYVSTKHRVTAEALAIVLVLAVYDRKMELLFRKLFLWKEECKREKGKAMDLQRKNEALVFNLMPAHVAKDFVGTRVNKRGLYSKGYEETGVIFAACPNFNAFYNESAVNNNGLECLRFLNEIISDYDELLNQPRFESIVKIKTVGPTYMAVSGMTQSGIKPFDQTVRWSHLDDLVQFAFGLQDVLRKINEQSFNNFILRIGINHGPLIAGVIGATKPHYDVWGNTVNVASRMESTGQPGRIQVVEETKTILEPFGYRFESRGLINVKGKGQLVTYFLDKPPNEFGSEVMPNQVPDS